MKATYHKHTLNFKLPAGTSRGILKTKDTFFLLLFSENKTGIGECNLFRGLSIDDTPDYEDKLQWVCDNITLGFEKLYSELENFPSIQMGLETAFKSLDRNDPFSIFPSNFSRGEETIPINGLIWMGDIGFMKQQVSQKIEEGFRCIKLKIGALDFATEINLLKKIRKEFSASEIELRVDANGAFLVSTALEKLKMLSDFNLHSIEQPIRQGQWQEMAALCEQSPLPIALDEELIGVNSISEKKKLLTTINPSYIILKPTLVGGFAKSDEWIALSEEFKIGWWITSALESNIGLNAISQFTSTKNVKLPHGLGTGGLYTNNLTSPLYISNGSIGYNRTKSWDLSGLSPQLKI